MAPFIDGCVVCVGGGVELTAFAVVLSQNSASEILLPACVGGGDAQGFVCLMGSGSGMFRPWTDAV